MRLSRLATYPQGEWPIYRNPRHAPRFRWTGEHRPPRRGEWYLSGAVIEAYRAPNNLAQSYAIAEPVTE